MVSINLKDAYLSVSMAGVHRKYLRFQWQDQLYEFQCLPFGLCSAPRIFTKLFKPVMALVRLHGVRSVVFLDDILLLAQSKEDLSTQATLMSRLLKLLGFVINQEKSHLKPTQRIQYLGFTISSQSMTISLPCDKVEQIKLDCQWALSQQAVSVRDLCRIIGRLTASIQAVLPAPLQYRRLQRLKNLCFAETQDFDAHVTLDQGSRKELAWWRDNLDSWNGKTILTPPPNMSIETDASLLGWDAVKDKVSTNGLWSVPERALHISVLELKAGAFAVKTFASSEKNIHVHLRMDNRTAVSYINRMGGTRSFVLAQQACQLWQWCLQRGITISAEYLPGVDNCVADQESRLLQSSAEWKLNKQVLLHVIKTMGNCSIDLFATRLNNQLRQYVSWRPDPFTIATDAMTLNWKDREAYAFPPFCLIGRCLQKVEEEKATLILIAPTWSTQPWYPVLLDLLIAHPLLLPQRPDFLTDPFNQFYPRSDLQL